MIRLMVKEFINIIKLQSIMESGLTIKSKVKELKHGLMVQSTKANTKKGKKMDKESFIGVTVLNMKEISGMIISKVSAYTGGWMVDNIKEHGKKIKCMEKGSSCGKMVEGM